MELLSWLREKKVEINQYCVLKKLIFNTNFFFVGLMQVKIPLLQYTNYSEPAFVSVEPEPESEAAAGLDYAKKLYKP